MSDEDAVAVDRPDLDDMSREELQEEYADLTERSVSGGFSATSDPELWERMHEMWDVLRERADVEQPKCPDCGARNWGQAVGEPIHCRECSKEGVMDDELREEIHESWEAILHG